MRDFSHLNTGKFSHLHIWGVVTLASMIIGGLVAFFVFYFSVQNIVAPREKDDLNLRYAALLQMLDVVKGKNLIILSPEFLEKQIKIRFPEISEVSISKKYPRTLVVEAKIAPVLLKLVYKKKGDDEEFFGYLSKDGTFFQNGDPELFTLFEKDPRKEHLSLMEHVFQESEISDILEGKTRLEEVTQRKIVSAELLKNAQEIHYLDEHGVKYWLFLGKDFSEQIEKLARTLQERDVYKTSLAYIDLRIGRKLIYKPKQ